MTSYVSCNRLRARMVGGLCGRSGTASDASALYNIVHGLGTPTIFGAVMETHVATTTAQFSRRCAVRLTGPILQVRILTAAAGAVAPSATATFRWFAAE